MLFKQKGTKRQSFSVESLAISSHDEQQERDTDSPYLCYLESRKSPSSVDYNSNDNLQKWINSAHVNGMLTMDLRLPVPENMVHGSFERQTTLLPSMSHMPNHSTPIMPSPKRRRLDSTCTPPSSDESFADDRMVIDTSNVSCPEEEKQSPTSTAYATSGM
jgi:hypothetical protein